MTQDILTPGADQEETWKWWKGAKKDQLSSTVTGRALASQVLEERILRFDGSETHLMPTYHISISSKLSDISLQSRVSVYCIGMSGTEMF